MNMETMNEVIVGIDLGTTQSAVGVVESGFPILLANEEGSRLTPSAVWYGKSGEVEVGALALRRRGVVHVLTSVWSLMGRRSDEVDDPERVCFLSQLVAPYIIVCVFLVARLFLTLITS